MSDLYKIINYLRNEEPMESALNSAHSSSRRAERHMKYGRYDEAIKCHSETVNFLTRAIAESTIPKNIENLQLQRKHHENMQQIIARKKREFAELLNRYGLTATSEPRNQTQKENRDQFKGKVNADAIDKCYGKTVNDEFFGLVRGLKIDDKYFNKGMVTVKHEDDDGFITLR